MWPSGGKWGRGIYTVTDDINNIQLNTHTTWLGLREETHTTWLGLREETHTTWLGLREEIHGHVAGDQTRTPACICGLAVLNGPYEMEISAIVQKAVVYQEAVGAMRIQTSVLTSWK